MARPIVAGAATVTAIAIGMEAGTGTAAMIGIAIATGRTRAIRFPPTMTRSAIRQELTAQPAALLTTAWVLMIAAMRTACSRELMMHGAVKHTIQSGRTSMTTRRAISQSW